MTDLPFQDMTKGLNDPVAVTSLQTHETIQHPTVGFTRLAKIALFVSLSLAILIIFASTAAGTRMLGQLGMRASAAELASEARGDAKSGNVLTAFLSRSPGERGTTDAIKGKAKAKGDEPQPRKAATAATPKQRALGKVFDNPASKVAAATLPQPVLEFLPANIASEPDTILASIPPVLGGSSIFAPVIGGGIGGGGGFIGGGGGGGSGGGGGGGNVINPPPVPAVASAVPEPSTWILLLLGFAAIGASSRRPKSANPLMLGKVESCATN